MEKKRPHGLLIGKGVGKSLLPIRGGEGKGMTLGIKGGATVVLAAISNQEGRSPKGKRFLRDRAVSSEKKKEGRETEKENSFFKKHLRRKAEEG